MFVHCPCCCHHMSLLVGPKDDYLFLDRLYIKGKVINQKQHIDKHQGYPGILVDICMNVSSFNCSHNTYVCVI